MISHCKEKIISAQDYVCEDVTMVNGKTIPTFKVKSHTQVYEVQFGNKDTWPSCECIDWERTRLPCKHFFAVFQCLPEWSFENLPEHYRQSPFLTLDQRVIFGVHQASDKNQDNLPNEHPPFPSSYNIEKTESTLPCSQPPANQSDNRYGEFQKHKRFCKTAATQCRELLNEIKNLTFITEDIDVIKDVNNTLHLCVEKLKSYAPKSNNLMIDKNMDITKKQKTIVNDKKYKDMPQPNKRKHPFSGRVGHKAQKMRKLFMTTSDVLASDKRNEKLNVLEELAPIDISLDKALHVSSNDKLQSEANLQLDNKKESYETNYIAEHQKQDFQAKAEKDDKIQIDSPTKFVNLKEKNNEDQKDDLSSKYQYKYESDGVQITHTGKRPASQQNKCPKLVLSPEERSKIITVKRMITDESINIAHNLLSNQFPNIKGLEHSTLGPVNGFSVFRGPFIQILHTGCAHWVCTSNIFTKKDDMNRTLNYYDSLCTGNPPLRVQQNISQFLYCSDAEITIEMKSVQQQSPGSNNCGLFAIAFATSLAFGQDPTNVTYNEQSLRTHLLHCIDNNSMTPFPAAGSRRPPRKCKQMTVKVEVLCTCRMPFDKKRKMAECESCLNWFHQECEAIPDCVFTGDEEWVCLKCKTF